eukprot:TRINITY_DN25634_c0_g1_i1.p2 TRINITY_DN25634_c0_g1~~TRINITY_DN25634_c0_g1_i1.p2  ORF type:complete len:206 (+),score=78.28 TRINITY_DN25634_c0_g1_i1:150-767(+)
MDPYQGIDWNQSPLGQLGFLPEVLLRRILKYLPAFDLARLVFVSSALRRLAVAELPSNYPRRMPDYDDHGSVHLFQPTGGYNVQMHCFLYNSAFLLEKNVMVNVYDLVMLANSTEPSAVAQILHASAAGHRSMVLTCDLRMPHPTLHSLDDVALVFGRLDEESIPKMDRIVATYAADAAPLASLTDYAAAHVQVPHNKQHRQEAI